MARRSLSGIAGKQILCVEPPVRVFPGRPLARDCVVCQGMAALAGTPALLVAPCVFRARRDTDLCSHTRCHGFELFPEDDAHVGGPDLTVDSTIFEMWMGL